MNTNENIYIIGLIGRSGSGKSTVSRFFSANNFYVIDADALSRKASNMEAFLDEVSLLFPKCVANGSLDRKITAATVFSDREALDKYTSIIFPYITQLVFDSISQAKKEGYKFVLFDAPTLFESGLDDICNAVVCVVASSETLLERLTARDGITKDMASLRLSSQKSAEWYTNKSDYNISNNGTPQELEIATLKIITKIKERFND